MNNGLSDETVAAIQGVLSGYPEVEKAVLYGSRAKGNYKNGSDIDLTLFGEQLSDAAASRIYWALDDLLLPYTIDLSLFSQLRHAGLIDHIRRLGVVLHERDSPSQDLADLREAVRKEGSAAPIGLETMKRQLDVS